MKKAHKDKIKRDVTDDLISVCKAQNIEIPTRDTVHINVKRTIEKADKLIGKSNS